MMRYDDAENQDPGTIEGLTTAEELSKRCSLSFICLSLEPIF